MTQLYLFQKSHGKVFYMQDFIIGSSAVGFTQYWCYSPLNVEIGYQVGPMDLPQIETDLDC